MASSAVGAYSIAICATVPMSDMTDAPSVGAYSERDAPSCSTADGSCSESAAMAAPAMTAMRGTMFDAAVVTESTSCVVSFSMSASSLPSSVTQFCQAAFAMLTLPSMVVAASRIVVPPICMDSCMTWIAATTLSKLIEVPSTVTPSFSCTSVSFDASLMRRCISC